MKIVTGASGLLGSAFKNIYPQNNFLDSNTLDLTNRKQTLTYFEDMQNSKRIQAVIHLAGKVGGVKANTEFVSDFYAVNSAINNNVIDACIKAKIPKLVCCLSTCIYPDEKYVNYPLTEDQLHNGPPHHSNFGYAYAKRMVDVQLRAARQQYGFQYISVVPNNMYGERDNFDLENGHVIPALIRKIWEAKIDNKPYFEVWGDGEIYREFTYAGDIAKIILFCLEKYEDEVPINIGNTQEYSLKETIEIIKKQLDYKGDIIFDTSKPKGQVRKPSSNQKLVNLGWKNEWYTPLETGLKNTCKWFIDNYPNVRGVK